MFEDKTKKTSLILLAFSIMFIIGFTGNMRGILLPAIKSSLAINYSSIGTMIIVSGLGYMSSTFINGFLCDKFGHKKVLAFGFALVFLGLVGLGFTRSFTILLLTMAILYLGLGSFDIALNSLTPRIFTVNTAIMVSFMHVFYGLGSAFSPKIGGWLLLKNIPWYTVYLYSIALVAFVFVLFIFSPSLPSPDNTQYAAIPVKKLLTDKKVWLFIGVLGFCESTELGISGWLVNFLQAVRGMDEGSSSQYMFYFFITFTIGRVFGGYIAEKLGYVRTILLFVSTSILLFAGGLLLGNNFVILFSAIGFFVSIMFPTMITIISKEFPQNGSSAMGLIITAAGLTGMISNWLIGILNDAFGVNLGFASILIFAFVIILLLSLLSKTLTYGKPNADFD